MVKDHSHSKRKRVGLHFLIAAKGLLYAAYHRIAHTTVVTPVVEPWLEQEIAQRGLLQISVSFLIELIQRFITLIKLPNNDFSAS